MPPKIRRTGHTLPPELLDIVFADISHIDSTKS